MIQSLFVNIGVYVLLKSEFSKDYKNVNYTVFIYCEFFVNLLRFIYKFVILIT